MTSLCQAFVAVVFVGAALAKLADYGGFLRALTGLEWISVGRARFLARAIPGLELLLAALVVLSRSTALGAVLVGAALGFAFLLVEVGLEIRAVASSR